MKKLIAVALAFAGGIVLADNFPVGPKPASGKWDLASADDWGGAVPSATADVVVTNYVGAGNVTVTASADVEFNCLQNLLRQGYNYWLYLDMTGYEPVRKIKLNNGFLFGTTGWGNTHTAFKGGCWDFGGQGFCKAGGSSYGVNRKLLVTDGAVITNAGTLCLGYTNQQGLEATISGNSQVWLNGNFKFANNKDSATRNQLLVCDGSLLDIKGTLAWEDGFNTWAQSIACQKDGAFFYKDYLIVSNGTLNARAQYSNLGSRGGDATWVTAGGELTFFGDAWPWSGHARNNLTRVDNGGKLTFRAIAYGGWGGGAHPGFNCNRMEVLENGEVDAKSTFYLGYSYNTGNTLVVSNGMFYAKEFAISDTVASSNETVLIQGSKASFSVADRATFTLFPQGAPNNRYIVDDNATFVIPNSFSYYTYDCHHCSLIARRGGKLSLPDGLQIGHRNLSEGRICTSNNTVIAEEDGIVEMNGITVCGSDSGLRVDNGIVALTNAANSLTLGYTTNYGGIGTNSFLEVSGSRPRISIAGSFNVLNGSSVSIALPEDGYENGVVPLRIGTSVAWRTGCTFTITGAQALYDHLVAADVRTEYVLAENPEDKAFFPEDVIESLRDQVKDCFKLMKRVKDGKNQLVLKGGAPRGATLLIR